MMNSFLADVVFLHKSVYNFYYSSSFHCKRIPFVSQLSCPAISSFENDLSQFLQFSAQQGTLFPFLNKLRRIDIIKEKIH